MIATHASTPTNATRYATATYFSPLLTLATPDASSEEFPQLAQALVQPLARPLDAVHRRREREQAGPRDAEGEEHRAGHLRPVAREHRRVDEVVRQANREPADRDQHDPEKRVDRAHVRARGARVDGV